MLAHASTLHGQGLADALGSELLAVAPYFVMYVTYCANFMAGSEMLGRAQKTHPELDRVIRATEEQITRRNILERGLNSQVSIYAFLIKPVQRLCQYPLLFREIVKAMPAKSPTAPEEGPKRGGGSARVRPLGGAATAAPPGGIARAQYVLAVLEEVALDVNEKVRAQEESVRVLQQLGLSSAAGAKGGSSSELIAAILGPAASLVLEVGLEIATDASGHPLGLARGSWRPKLVRRMRAGHDGMRPGKLFLFRDRLLLARKSSGKSPHGGAYEMLACWPLEEIAITPPEAGGEQARVSMVLERYGASGRPEEHVKVMCDHKDASELSSAIAKMHQLVDSLRLRQGRGPRMQLAAALDDEDDVPTVSSF